MSVTVGLVLATFAALALWGGQASAQGRLLDDRPTRGVLIPAASLIADPSASAMEMNPAGLGYVKTWSLAYHHAEMDWDGSRGGTGDALFWAQAIPWINVVYGLGAQYLRWPDSFGPGYGDVGKLSLAAAWKIGFWGSVAVAYHRFVGPSTPALSGMSTWELAALFRPWPEIACGVKVSDVLMPRWHDSLPLQRTWDLEVGWRPAGTDRITLSVGGRLQERRLNLDPRFRAEIRAWRGLVVRADVEYRHRSVSWSDPQQRDELFNDLRATVALEVAFSNWGFGVGAAFGRNVAELPGSVFQGLTASAWLSGESRPSVYEGPDRAVVVKVIPEEKGEREFWKLVGQLDELAGQPSVKAVLVSIPDSGPGWARAQEIRSLMKKLREEGKKVIAYIKTPGAQAYYLATAADRIWLFPGGAVMMAGLGLTRLYFKEALDRLGVRVQVIKHGAYKTAPETFNRTSPTPESDEVKKAVLDQTFEEWIGALATRKQIGSRQKARKLLEKGPFTPEEAKKWGLVDALVYEEKASEQLQKMLGRPVALTSQREAVEKDIGWGLRPAVAVVLVEGDIVPGRSQRIPIINRVLAGYETLGPIIKQIQADSRIEAVVFRIDSPGGTAETSEMLWRQIMELRKHKPVIASLADVAASGGYQMAAAADTIIAEPATLTGSIGIFAAKPDVSGLMAKLGIDVHRWHRGAFPSLKTPFKPYTKEQVARLTEKLKEIYLGFVRNVAKGRRNLSFEQVEPLARGRVWTGLQAKSKGLVDRLGGLSDAVALARSEAGLDETAPVIVYPQKKPSLLMQLARAFLTQKNKSRRWSPLSPLEQAFQALIPSLLVAPDATFYARCRETIKRQ
jgi:protease-4